LGSHPIAQALHETAPDRTVAPTRSEADMRHITISGHHAGHHAVAAAFWIVAAFWVVAGIVAAMAPVTHLRRSQCDLKEISAHASWCGPVARTAQRSFVAPQHQDLY
jgi:hypothetical protein